MVEIYAEIFVKFFLHFSILFIASCKNSAYSEMKYCTLIPNIFVTEGPKTQDQNTQPKGEKSLWF